MLWSKQQWRKNQISSLSSHVRGYHIYKDGNKRWRINTSERVRKLVWYLCCCCDERWCCCWTPTYMYPVRFCISLLLIRRGGTIFLGEALRLFSDLKFLLSKRFCAFNFWHCTTEYSQLIEDDWSNIWDSDILAMKQGDLEIEYCWWGNFQR